MGVFKKPALVLFIVIGFPPLKAQYTNPDSLGDTEAHKFISGKVNSHPYKSFVLPLFMVAYGFITLKSDPLQDINEGLQEEVWDDNPHRKLSIDNFMQFAPAAAVYGLNLAGIHGKNNLRDRSIIYLMSNIFLNVSVTSLKNITKQERPDGSSNQSFPSGHTAEAFASAEFLRHEYGDASPCYVIAGYATATATGLLRIYNNKHWLSDVVTGAGIGIASTNLAYLIYPAISRMFFKNENVRTIVMPYYQNRGVGLSLVHKY